ncbi:MAG: beta-galactosidase [bacterium]
MSTKKWVLLLGVIVLAVSFKPAPRAESAGPDYFRDEFSEPLRSVELQYFRVPPDKWDMMLTRMAQYNADTISTYVHWGYHEYEEGKFDFTGKTLPGRDLARFIELCGKKGLKLILKPGPFIDAETNAGGIPQWLFKNHPETIAVNKKGEPFIHGDSGMPRISYLHPRYLELVDRYFHELGKRVARYQWPDGPIIAVQVDNETPGDGFITMSNFFTHNFKADYNSYYRNELWPDWLKERYGTVESLNDAYGSSYSSFAEVPMPDEWTSPSNRKEFRIYMDLDKFAEFQYVEALRRMRAMLEDSGFYAPTYQDLLCMPWDLSGLLGDIGGMAEASGGWIGSNVYAEVYRLWTIFVGNLVYKYNWDEYVHMAVWRTRLSGTLSEPYPAFVPEITCSERFYFQAPVAWGADAVNIYVGWQTPEDNEKVAPEGSWGMEACVTATGGIRDCFWNGKNTYLFMEHSGGFLPGAAYPEVALGYSHEPEHAWNWEFRFNFDKPHKRVRHDELKDIVKGTNTANRTQLIAREFVKNDFDFDVIHMDHLKPGQANRYKLLVVPTSPLNPMPEEGPLVEREGGYTLYLPPEGKDEVDAEFFRRKGVTFRKAYADSEEVDVIKRRYDENDLTVVSVANRSADEWDGPVHFREGDKSFRARLGPKSVGFASLEHGEFRAAVIDHPEGKGAYSYNGDELSFSGTFATIVNQPQYVIASAPDSGEVKIKSGRRDQKPAKLYRIAFDGTVEEKPFHYEKGVFSFRYDAGKEQHRTDLYVALEPGASLHEALGDYAGRAGISLDHDN